MEAESQADIVLQAIEIQVGPAGGHLAGVVEQGHIQEAIRQDAPFRLKQQRVAIAEAPARESA